MSTRIEAKVRELKVMIARELLHYSNLEREQQEEEEEEEEGNNSKNQNLGLGFRVSASKALVVVLGLFAAQRARTRTSTTYIGACGWHVRITCLDKPIGPRPNPKTVTY